MFHFKVKIIAAHLSQKENRRKTKLYRW